MNIAEILLAIGYGCIAAAYAAKLASLMWDGITRLFM